MKQIALVTGASRGIGRATAFGLARAGYHVVLNYNNSHDAACAALEEMKNEGLSGEIIRADVANSAAVDQMMQAVLGAHGRLDVLINNAAISSQMLFTDITDAHWKELMDVNINGVFYCCRAALPAMISQKAGAIVNLSSVWGMTGASCEVHYCAAKAALIGLTKALAKEVGPSGIRVNCVAPGVIDTDMNRGFSKEDLEELREVTPLGRIGTPEEVASAVVFLAGDSASFLTGQVISPNGGFLI